MLPGHLSVRLSPVDYNGNTLQAGTDFDAMFPKMAEAVQRIGVFSVSEISEPR